MLFPLVNVTDFSFIFLTQIFVLCLEITTAGQDTLRQKHKKSNCL